MEANRCAAICVNGRHCAKTINNQFVDLCTQHGRMEAGGQHLQRYQVAVAQPPPQPQRDNAARVIQGAARRLLNEHNEDHEHHHEHAHHHEHHGVHRGVARLFGPIPENNEEVVMMTEAQFRILLTASRLGRGERRQPEVDITPRNEPPNDAIARLFERVNRQKIPVFANLIGDTCSICQESVAADQREFGMPCGHATHFDCAVGLRSNHCPVCRAEFFHLREQTEETNRVVTDILERKHEDKRERERQANRPPTAEMLREIQMQFEGEPDDSDEERHDEDLPEFGSPEYDEVMSIATNVYMNHPEFEDDPQEFHDHLHDTLGIQNCEFIMDLIRRIITQES